MTGTAIMTSIIEILTGGITGVATGIGGGLTTLVSNLFFTGTGETQTLSVFAVILVVFAGISLALGLCRWVVNWISSFGSRNR